MQPIYRILLVHNYYKQRGGEDVVFERERALLKSRGHEVFTYMRTNDEIDDYSFSQKIRLPFDTIWARRSAEDLTTLIREQQPDIVHFHNTFPLISPSVYYTCKHFEIPVIQTLNNPRLLCPTATLYRNEQLCLDCLGKTPPWPGIIHSCYRDSILQTSAVAGMLSVHRWLGTWKNEVDLYFVATEFYRQVFAENGIPPNKLAIKPQFVSPDPGLREGGIGSYALFIGRLEPAKGIWTLLEAWRDLPEIPLIIRGGGPETSQVRKFIEENQIGNIQLVGPLDQTGLIQLIKQARVLIWPSEGYYETFGMVVSEAFACGVPVIASNIGVGSEIVRDHWNGRHFQPGDAHDLREKVSWVFSHPAAASGLGQNGRLDYLEKFTAEHNYDLLMEYYGRLVRP